MSRRAPTMDVTTRLGIGAGAAMLICCVVAPALVVWAAARLLRRITATPKEAK